MKRPSNPTGSQRAGHIAHAAAYLCMFVVLVNLSTHIGWIHVRLPFVTGFAARWGWSLAAVVCFVLLWYIERYSRNRPT